VEKRASNKTKTKTGSISAEKIKQDGRKKEEFKTAGGEMISSHPQGKLAEHEERRIKEMAERRKNEHKIMKKAIQKFEMNREEKSYRLSKKEG
jgi:hypothetical protein